MENFKDREHLENEVSNLKEKVNLLLQNRKYERKFSLVVYFGFLISAIIADIIVIKNNFNGDRYISFFLGTMIGYFGSKIIYCYMGMKKYNEDDLTNEEIEVMPESIRYISTGSLRVRIKQCVKKEKYELAAMLRDELKRRIKQL